MSEAQVRTVEQVRQVLEGTQELQFRAAEDDEGRYGWIDAVQMLEQFPFEILDFHADNGSEYVNHRVARMLDKLRVTVRACSPPRCLMRRSRGGSSACTGRRTR